jgi:hypothetical protein
MEDQAIRQFFEKTAEETRRHFDVVAEGLRKEVQLVAEGVASLNDQVVHLRGDMTRELTEVKSMIRLSYTELDRRLRTLEDTVLHLAERVNRLEAGRSH